MKGKGNRGFWIRKMGATFTTPFREPLEVSVNLESLKMQEREKWQMGHSPKELTEDIQTLETVVVLNRWKMDV